jgi:hypothetical protein
MLAAGGGGLRPQGGAPPPPHFDLCGFDEGVAFLSSVASSAVSMTAWLFFHSGLAKETS